MVFGQYSMGLVFAFHAGLQSEASQYVKDSILNNE